MDGKQTGKGRADHGEFKKAKSCRRTIFSMTLDKNERFETGALVLKVVVVKSRLFEK